MIKITGFSRDNHQRPVKVKSTNKKRSFDYCFAKVQTIIETTK